MIVFDDDCRFVTCFDVLSCDESFRPLMTFKSTLLTRVDLRMVYVHA